MNVLRRGVVACVLGGAVLMTGCQGKWMSQADLEKINQDRRLNEEQASLVTALTNDKERLTSENAAIRAQMQDKVALINAQDQMIKDLQAKGIGVKAVGAEPSATPDTELLNGPKGVIIRMKSDLLFSPGSATLSDNGAKVVHAVADSIKDKTNRIEVDGFTDSQPIKHSGWKSNFDLSGARALAVLEALKKDGIAPDRMHFAGYGEYSLVPGADGKEDAKRSRRAEIVLLNEGVDAPAVAPAPAKTHPAPKKTPPKAVVPK